MTIKQLFLRIICILLVGLPTWSASAERLQLCYHGLRLEISQDKHWGYGLPIITSIDRYSPAEHSGLAIGSIVKQIDGIATEGLTLEQVYAMLESPSREHVLEATSLSQGAQSYLLQRSCRPLGSLSEQDLAQLFAHYSVEDTRMLLGGYPYTYSSSSMIEPGSLRTYAFAPSSAESEAIDRELNGLIGEILSKMGLRETIDSPDMLIYTDYSLNPMESDSTYSSAGKPYSWRFNTRTREIDPLPLLEANSPDALARYQLSLGITFVRPDTTQQTIWRVEARERLSAPLNLVEYARHSLPTMLRFSPKSEPQGQTTYLMQTLRYQYTGLIFNRKDLSQIIDMDLDSPAARAGIRPGDVIRSINGRRLEGKSLEALFAAYESFIEETKPLREQSAPLYNTPHGDQGLAPWAKEAYTEIARQIERQDDNAFFAYLFSFRPWIQEHTDAPLLIEIERPGGRYRIEVMPEIRDASYITPVTQ